MKNLHKINIYKYWIDFIISLLSFFSFFYLTYNTHSILLGIITSIFLYRVGAFTHEIAHQNNHKSFKVFKIVWNVVGGCLILQPSLRFMKPHLQHHTTGIFATKEDPQYPLIFNNIWLAAFIFILLPYLLPIYNFIVCIIPFKNNWFEGLLSKSKFTNREYLEIKLYEYFYLVVWGICIWLIPSVVIHMYIISVAAWFLSVLRIPLEHPLNEYKIKSTCKDQQVLSYTHECFLYIIVQPLGLRYHTVHHMYPKIPYHNLGILNKRFNKV